MTTLPEKLARLNYQIWHYDDLRNFKKVNGSAKVLFRMLRYKNYENIAKHVTKAYRVYANLDDETTTTREKIKRKNSTFLLIEKEIFKAAKIVDPKTANQIAKFHTNWWFYFFKKKKEPTFLRKLKDYREILRFIYKQHAVKHSKKIAIVLTLLLFLAGLLGHNRRIKKVGEYLLTQYWQLTLKINNNPFMF